MAQLRPQAHVPAFVQKVRAAQGKSRTAPVAAPSTGKVPVPAPRKAQALPNRTTATKAVPAPRTTRSLKQNSQRGMQQNVTVGHANGDNSQMASAAHGNVKAHQRMMRGR